MSKLYKMILESSIRKKGKEAGIMLAVFNIATLLALQEASIDIPYLLKLNVLFLLTGIFFLEVRPWR